MIGLPRVPALAYIAIAFACSAPAYADAGFSGGVSLMSDYRIRGVSQNDLQPSPQGEVDWNGVDGWSLGARATKVNFEDHADTSIETDFIVGKQLSVAGTPVLLQATYFAYPDHRGLPGSPRYSMAELSGLVSQTWGKWSVSGSVAWSPDYFGEIGPAAYVSGGVSYTVTRWLTISANSGVQWVSAFDHDPRSGFPYLNGDIGVTASQDSLSLDIRMVSTDLSRTQCRNTQGGGRWCGPTVIATFTYATDAPQ